jgi:hypothetical protein
LPDAFDRPRVDGFDRLRKKLSRILVVMNSAITPANGLRPTATTKHGEDEFVDGGKHPSGGGLADPPRRDVVEPEDAERDRGDDGEHCAPDRDLHVRTISEM